MYLELQERDIRSEYRNFLVKSQKTNRFQIHCLKRFYVKSEAFISNCKRGQDVREL